MFLATLRLAEVLLNPLLQLPAFTLSCVVLDWLHVVDLGVGADVLGNLFWEIMSHNNLIAGNTKATRLSALWVKLQAWYVRVKPVCKLDNLTEEMIKGKKKNKAES
jgi:hypothetical protein